MVWLRAAVAATVAAAVDHRHGDGTERQRLLLVVPTPCARPCVPPGGEAGGHGVVVFIFVFEFVAVTVAAAAVVEAEACVCVCFVFVWHWRWRCRYRRG